MWAHLQAKHKASEATEGGKETAQETVASGQHSSHHVLPQVGSHEPVAEDNPVALLPGRAALQRCSGLHSVVMVVSQG